MGKRIGRFGLVNYADHPTDKTYKVFNFNTPEEAALFEEELNKRNVGFEKGEELHEGAIMYLYAVREREFDRAQQANFMASAGTRKLIIPSVILRTALFVFFFGMIALAIIGYVKNT